MFKGLRIARNKPNSGSFIKGEHRSPNTEFKKGEFLGKNHPFWKGGRRKVSNGYIMCYAPSHLRAYKNFVLEHIIVAEKKIGRYLKLGERVHHINGIKDDNSPENLIVCKTTKEHFKHHKLNRWSKKFDNCRRCKTTEKKHEARGLCGNCYKIILYHRKLCKY